jgi:sugar transferase (PEP-CTERM/EpsH1 system associated)
MGGLENGVVNLINHLDWTKYVHMICCITQGGSLMKRIQRPDVQFIELKKKGGNDWLLPFRLARLFKSIKPHIVHTRNWGTIDGIVGARLGNVPITIHGEHGRTIGDFQGPNRRQSYARWALSPLVDQFVAVSPELHDWLINTVGISPRKVKVIYNGVDVKKFSPQEAKDQLRTKYGLNVEELIIGTVGRLDPVKDHLTLIRAFHQLISQFNQLRLLIVGCGPCHDELSQLSKELGLQDKITFLGERQEIPDLLNCMDIFVLPSLFEGISNTVLEAMSTGLAVIVTQVGGNPDLVENGVSGQLFPRQDIQELVRIVKDYINNPRKMSAHGYEARKRVQEKFSLDAMLHVYDGMYEGLLFQKDPGLCRK